MFVADLSSDLGPWELQGAISLFVLDIPGIIEL